MACSKRVKEHLECFGLVCKAPKLLQDGVNILGLHVRGDGEKLCWRRGSDVPEVPPVITCQNIFSMCGKLVSHFPIYGWLRMVAAAIKCCVTSVMSGWDNKVHNITLRCMITETVEKVMLDDPMQGD